MEGKTRLRKAFAKNIFFYFIVCTILFLILGALIYNTVSHNIYDSADTQLLNFKENQAVISYQLKEQTTIVKEKKESGKSSDIESEDVVLTKTQKDTADTLDPRPIYVLRNKNKEIDNSIGISSVYKDLIDGLTFDADNLNKIYMVKLLDRYQYRAINYAIYDKEKLTSYMQVLINVDAEVDILDHFVKELALYFGLAVLLSAIVSYFFTKRTLKPITVSWKRQTEFVQNASHELRTPLTIIRAGQELLLSKPNSKITDNFEELNMLLNETRRLSKLVEDLMTLSLADGEKAELTKESLELSEFIENICQGYNEFIALEGKAIHTELKYPGAVYADKDKMRQLLGILLDNSIKYTEAGDVITVLTYVKEGKCCIQVKDTGIGISKVDQHHVFERFYRADKARTRKNGGSGLGLSIADAIVGLHGGSIQIANNAPKGTVVTIKLPK